MLSGLTSQLGTLIGSNKSKDKETPSGSGTTEDGGPAPAQDSNGSGGDGGGGGGLGGSPGSGSHPASPPPEQQPATSVLSSVRNHIPSWLSGGKFLGGKSSGGGGGGTDETAATAGGGKGGAEDGGGGATSGSGEMKKSSSKDSNASGSTEGADSDNQVSEGEEKGIGLEKVKNLGNFLFSTIKGAGQKIKDTNILSDFQREHDSFLKGKMGKSEAIPPWIGHPKEDALKEEILSLSSDRRNFVRSPPSGVSFSWDWEEMAPVARAILKEDPNLETMRYELVPKVITEEHFWRNYFYRVSLLKESMSESEDEPTKKENRSGARISTASTDDELEKEINEELRSFEVVGGQHDTSSAEDKEIEALLDLK